MKLYNVDSRIAIEHNKIFYILENESWDVLINRKKIHKYLNEKIATLTPVGDNTWLASQTIDVPIGTQEVWAAGVTYLRSKQARMEESESSGGASFYDKVYDAERPELFFKANAHRVVPTNAPVRIRKDSSWNVPEPELTLVINSDAEIVGYTIGNDMSSRSIEGENPLYLPQAKVYDGSAAIGPCILLKEDIDIEPDTVITIEIKRADENIYKASTTISQMKRTHQELVSYLFKEYSFSTGAYLMTGTCLVPENGFTLQTSDEITISIDNIGVLKNVVV